MFFRTWLYASAIIFAILSTSSLLSSTKEYFSLAPSIRNFGAHARKFKKNLIWGLFIFALFSFFAGLFIAGTGKLYFFIFN